MKKLILMLIISLLYSCTIYTDYPCPGAFFSRRHQLKLIDERVIKGDSVAIFQCFREDGYGRRICPFRDTIIIYKNN